MNTSNALIRHKGKILAALAVLCALAFTYWWGGNAPGLRGWKVPAPPAPASSIAVSADTAAPPGAASGATAPDTAAPGAAAPDASLAPGASSDHPLNADEKLALAEKLAGGQSSEGVEQGDADYSAAQGMQINPDTGKDRYLTEPVPEGRPVPVEPQNAAITGKALTCTLSVRCDTILNNIKWLDPEKVELVPPDGVIFPAARVTFYEGESVFNILQREMKRARIHMEFENTPMYNSAYIEGINNLYEFDCGELSGWMYKVNGWFPNYGSSRYQLHDGDVVEWVYTCDLGIDVGGYYAAAGS